MQFFSELSRMHGYHKRGLTAVPVAPEPDYSDSEEENHQARANCRLPCTTPEGLIVPRKLANPCLESADRRQLHRELKFNAKTGRSVLNQKSELQRELERRRETQQRRQAQLVTDTNRSSFERALEERLRRAEQPPVQIVDDSRPPCDVTPEFMKVHAKVRANVNTLS
ncbi:actin-associated protein FAM107A-like isoform X2 [Amphibalanus amphitrite]|uniref:actin-associated protein FAM107A-like isoform X2 n=1 Tax=Amphibalanus amphitrite TaxID=1232801 RepID=UPI001C90F505|nr:actin-associated protein FAM107A-like isoform X2 [Amphibalanus amphitrite]